RAGRRRGAGTDLPRDRLVRDRRLRPDPGRAAQRAGRRLRGELQWGRDADAGGRPVRTRPTPCAGAGSTRLLAPLLAICLLLGGAAVGLAQGSQAFSLRPANSDPSSPAGGAYFVYAVGPGATKSDEVLVLNTG